MTTDEQRERAERMLQNPLANRDVPEPPVADRSRADSDAQVNRGGSDTARHYVKE